MPSKELRVGPFEATLVLRPVSDESPCGENPEYSDAFQRLEKAAHGREESQFAAGEEPDWRQVEEAGFAVLEGARELRTIGYLGQVFLSRGDWHSFAEAMKAIAGLLQDYWDCVHPQLDAEDGDPTERINAVEGIAHPDMLLGSLRQAPLVESREVGRFTVRDVAVALGKMEPREGDPVPDMSLITAAVRSIDADEIVAIHQDLQTAKSALNTSSRVFAEQLSASEAPALDPVVHLLDLSIGFLESYLPQEASNDIADDAASPGTQIRKTQPAGQLGNIQNRDDVVKLIDRICDFYARNEPSSPVPILMKRARYLVHKSFPEILADLVPTAAEQFSVFEGKNRAEASGEAMSESRSDSETKSSW